MNKSRVTILIILLLSVALAGWLLSILLLAPGWTHDILITIFGAVFAAAFNFLRKKRKEANGESIDNEEERTIKS